MFFNVKFLATLMVIIGSLLAAGYGIKDPNIEWIKIAGAIAVGLIAIGCLLVLSDEDYEKKHAESIILHELDPETGYIVYGKMSAAGRNTLELKNLATKEYRTAKMIIYPPTGFKEEKADGRTFLIPDQKKLIIGHKSEFVFAPELSDL